MNCDNVRNCCSPYSQLAQQLEETNTRAVQAYNLANQALSRALPLMAGTNIDIETVMTPSGEVNRIALKTPMDEDVVINADLTVNGDIYQNGTAYESHAEQLYTTKDKVIMRDGAVTGLSTGETAGLLIKKYDGVNDGVLDVDSSGTARVGDAGDEQPLATRDEAADLTDNHILKWDAANLKLVDSGIDADNLGGGLELVNASAHSYLPVNPGDDETVTITTGPFEAGYDYFLYIFYAGGENANVRGRYDTQTVGTTNVDLKIQALTAMSLYARLYRTASNDPLVGSSVRLNTISAPSTNTQEKLVSGTNIKTVGGQSLLGSGDVPAGGLTWTLRTANNDWTDMFQSSGGKITALKHVYLYIDYKCAVYIPKGLSVNTNIIVNSGYSQTWSTNIHRTLYRVYINQRIASNYSTINVEYSGCSFTTDGTTVTVSSYSDMTTENKVNFTILTAD